mgnify:CR=1 FL=1
MSLLGCSDGQYGYNCVENCSITCGDNCDKITGQCIGGCRAGWTGDMCKTGKPYVNEIADKVIYLMNYWMCILIKLVCIKNVL